MASAAQTSLQRAGQLPWELKIPCELASNAPRNDFSRRIYYILIREQLDISLASKH